MKVENLEQTCEAFPAQWEGTTATGRHVYIRYRHGWLSVQVSSIGSDTVWDAVIGVAVFSAELGDDLDGELEWSEVERLIAPVDVEAVVSGLVQ